MMQDYAKTVPPATRVGFTVIKEVWVGYSPVKNSVADALAKVAAGCPPHSAASGECDAYGAAARAMRLCGCEVGEPQERVFAGTPLLLWPRIVLSPATACSFTQLRDAVLPSPASVRITSASALVVRGSVVLEALELDGALSITAGPGARVVVRGLRVRNAGWEWRALGAGEEASAPEELRIRGFGVVRHAQRSFEFTEAGEHVLEGAFEE
jgi:UDP-sugar pyrophosphorylase